MRQPPGVAVRYLAVELGPEGVAEWAERRRAVFVPREDVVAIEVRHGVAGGCRAMQLVLGVLLMAAGAFFCVAFAGLIDVGFSSGAAPLTGASVPIVMLGGYVVWFATRPTVYLSVRGRRATRVLAFHGEADLASLAATLREARKRFGYPVTWTLPEERGARTPYRALDADEP